jgi:hypothetical protein
MKSTDQIAKIVAAGGGVVIDSSKSTDQLRSIARTAAISGAMVIIKNAGKKSTDQLCHIASDGKGKVVFDLTDD